MARLVVPQRATNNQLSIDATLPMTCVIESSYVTNGHGEYSIRVTRLSNDPSFSWLIVKRFREFVELNDILKEYGFDFQLPKKKLLGNTDRIFMAERQYGLQTFLNTLVEHTELCNSFSVHRFLDPNSHLTNYRESALQHVSMFIRSMNNLYQIIEPYFNFGWRYNKHYFLASKVGSPKDDRYLLIWCPYGLDKALGEKEILNCLKLIKSITHQLIVPIEDVYANESGTLTVYQFSNRGTLKDYIHRTKPANGMYWKRYGPTSSSRRCDLNQIKTIGRQILEALYFLYDNHLFYGHVHSGNILFDPDQSPSIKLLDVTNIITGVSSKYRYHITNLKHIHTLEQCDIYSFGRLLYELSTGEECPMSLCTELPCVIPVPVQEILSKIFAPTEDLPTVRQLLNELFFQAYFSNGFERFHMKYNDKAKEAFEQINRKTQERLENDRFKIQTARRQRQIANHLLSDNEKRRRHREKRVKALEKQMHASDSSTDTSKNLQPSINVDPLQKTTEVVANPKSPSANINAVTSDVPTTPAAFVNDDRTQLLSSIADFTLTKLRKTTINDRSQPKLE